MIFRFTSDLQCSDLIRYLFVSCKLQTIENFFFFCNILCEKREHKRRGQRALKNTPLQKLQYLHKKIKIKRKGKRDQ